MSLKQPNRPLFQACGWVVGGSVLDSDADQEGGGGGIRRLHRQGGAEGWRGGGTLRTRPLVPLTPDILWLLTVPEL